MYIFIFSPLDASHKGRVADMVQSKRNDALVILMWRQGAAVAPEKKGRTRRVARGVVRADHESPVASE